MKLLRYESLTTEETLSRLKLTKRKGLGQPLIYQAASLRLVSNVPTNDLVPAQRYVLDENINTMMDLYRQFLDKHVDIFHLTGAIFFWIERNGVEEGPIPLTPPIIETSTDNDGSPIWLINDGMHRVTTARCVGTSINIILAENVPEEYPYYALPLKNRWRDVALLTTIPEGFVKKEYRDKDNYKALFRDFNAVFDGIQKTR